MSAHLAHYAAPILHTISSVNAPNYPKGYPEVCGWPVDATMSIHVEGRSHGIQSVKSSSQENSFVFSFPFFFSRDTECLSTV